MQQSGGSRRVGPLIDHGGSSISISSVEMVDLHHSPTVLAHVLETNDGDYPPVQDFNGAKRVFFKESKKLWAVAGPITFCVLCNYGISSFTTVFVGHIGALELSAASISLSVIGNFALGCLLGMGSALETLCGQTFGAGQKEMMGVYMQRSIIVLFTASFLLLPLYIFATPILIAIGQEPHIAQTAGKFCLQIIPSLFSNAINFPTQRFLQAQSRVGILAWAGLGALALHTGLLLLFLKVLSWGTVGAAWAFNISSWAIALTQFWYIVGWCKEGWKGWSWLAFDNLWAFVKLSIASAVMLVLEIWYFMIIILLTGHLDNPVVSVASLSICMNLNGWEVMMFVGINAAISVRVSNELGSRHPRAAKYSVIVAVVQSFLLGLLIGVLVMATKDEISIIFTNSKEIQQAISRLGYLLGMTMVINSVQPILSGVAIGGGWQTFVAIINCICYYVVGLPLGFYLGYKINLRVEGIWIGMLCGIVLQTIVLLFYIFKTNWNKEVERVSKRLQKLSGQTE